MTAPTPEIARLDADLQMLALKREAAERFRKGLLGEYGHLLHDADPGAATRPFPDLHKGVSARFLDGGQS